MSSKPFDEASLRALGTGLKDGRLDREQYRQGLTALLLQRFGCSRATVWQLAGEAGRRTLRCVDARSIAGPLDAGYMLGEHEFGGYFAELIKTGVYVCSNTLADPKLAALRHRHEQPDGTRALLDAAFAINGAAFGVLCCEQTGGPRRWKLPEVCDLKRIAAIVSLQIARIDVPVIG